jgi:hypothetical protein
LYVPLPSPVKTSESFGPFRKARGWIARLASRLLPKGPEPAARRVLFLDDDPRRAETFLAEHPQAVWVETVVDCVERLRESWDEVHLDHDLGGQQHVDVDAVDCGMEVIRWMCKQPRDHLRSTQFLVHTHNMVAGLLMVLQMRSSGFKAEFQPFGQDLARVLAHNEPEEDRAPQNGVLDNARKRLSKWASGLRWRGSKSRRAPACPDSDSEAAAARPQPENCP